ncbi:MAG TPA: hypothetical protein VIF57_08275 [Polyangia bacterium]
MNGAGARVLVLLALAAAPAIATGGCGDDLPRLYVGLGGASGTQGGGGDTGGSGGVGGVGGTIGGAGNATGAAGSIGGAGAGGRGGGGGTGGAAGAGGGGRGGAGAAGRGGAGGAGGAAGRGGAGGTTPTPGYTGCSHVGGVYRITVTRQASADAGAAGTCFDLTLWSSAQAAPAGLTLPQGWSVMTGTARPCAGDASAPTATATAISGSVSWDPQFGFNLPAVVNLNVTLTFATNDAGVPATVAMNAQLVDIRTSCP